MYEVWKRECLYVPNLEIRCLEVFEETGIEFEIWKYENVYILIKWKWWVSKLTEYKERLADLEYVCEWVNEWVSIYVSR